MKKGPKLRRLLYKSPLWFRNSVYIQKIPKRLRRFWYKPVEKRKPINDFEGNYLQYNLTGLKNLTLCENFSFQIENNPYIETIRLADDLTKMTVYLKNGIFYGDNTSDIDSFVKQIIFNLIAKTDAEIVCPDWYAEGVFENGELRLAEHLKFQESIAVLRSYSAKSIYNIIINSPTAISKWPVLYERIFGILQNENIVVQFMSLYQILFEQTNFLARGKNVDKYGQKAVADYIKANKSKYPFVTFQKSRKASRTWKEDNFTYIRNEIGHCEKTNDINAYKMAGLQVDLRLIKNLLTVLNDVMIEL